MIQFPFTAIVGMEQAKRSLLYHAIDLRIGGALFLGHRGCAKSTLVRAFAEILQALSGDGARFVEVPLGTGEDRLLGSINAESLVEQGRWRSQAGLIEQANGGVLYIDEVNLLPDALADLILDSAASGQYRLERDGLTRLVESHYILIGTMNPEEGDLRPQLSDRFAHGVRISDEFSAEQRMQIVERRMTFDDEPERFAATYAGSTEELKRRLAHARTILKLVQISAAHRQAVAVKAKELKLEGVRAELAVIRTARCAAAWANRAAIEPQDIEEAWHLCLGHRQPEPPGASPEPPAAARRQPEPGRAPEPHRTPEGPSAAHPDARELSPTRITPHAQLQRWLERSPLQPAAQIKAARSGRSAPGMV
ncbi:MAG: AAA family ATPase, partial [Verrucomicrobiota bacterium]|nr:AAA family ATPase [Verrucomicrobiota bacterium]